MTMILVVIVVTLLAVGGYKLFNETLESLDTRTKKRFDSRQRRMRLPKSEQERLRKEKLDAQKAAHRSRYSKPLRKAERRQKRSWKRLQKTQSPADAVRYSKAESDVAGLKKMADRYASIMMRRDAAKEKREAKKFK